MSQELEKLYPNYSVDIIGDAVHASTTGLVFTRKPDGNLDAHFSKLRIDIKKVGTDEEATEKAHEKLKELVKLQLDRGMPIIKPIKVGSGFVTTPFYKTMKLDEVKDYYKECDILYPGESEV